MTKRTPESIVESLADGDFEFEPTGTVTLQLTDERGKIVHEETRNNFIAKTWKMYARWLLRSRWNQFGYNTGWNDYTSGNIMWPYGRATAPWLPNMALGCWNDTTAEDSTNETSLVVPSTGLVAWASKWPFSSPTGSRGAVNTTESVIDDAKARFVFDWATSTGNGTFQSIGWFLPGAAGVHAACFGAGHRARGVTTTFTPSTHITGATGLYAGGGWVDPATGTYYFPLRRQATSGAMRIASTSLANVLDDSLAGPMGVSPAVTGLTLTNQSDEFTPTGGTTAGNERMLMIGIDGSGNRIFVYPTTTDDRWGKIPSSGAGTFYTNPTTGFLGGGAVIGSHAYLAFLGSSSIFKCATSDGSTAATLTIDAGVTAACTLAGITTPRVQRMTTDGTDLIVIYGHSTDSLNGRWIMVRLNTSGVLQQIYGTVPHYVQSNTAEVTGAPYAGNFHYPQGLFAGVDDYGVTVDASASGATTEDRLFASGAGVTGEGFPYQAGGGSVLSASAQHHLVWYDGAPFLLEWYSGGSAVTQFQWGGFRYGYNLGSRVLLGSPQTKLNTQTMKIIYDVTLPSLLS